MKGVFPCSYELWAYGDQQCPCDPDLHAVAASSLFPAALSDPGSCRMGPHGAAGRVLERRSLPPGEMFSPLYGTGCTTLCAMSAPVQEKQTALSQLPARLLPPAVRAPPAAMRAKIDRLAQCITAVGENSACMGKIWVQNGVEHAYELRLGRARACQSRGRPGRGGCTGRGGC